MHYDVIVHTLQIRSSRVRMSSDMCHHTPIDTHLIFKAVNILELLFEEQLHSYEFF